MSGGVATTSSPLFTPSRLPLGHEWMPSPSSPLRPQLRRRLSGLRTSISREECSIPADPCSTSRFVDTENKALKRKRPARIDIPIMQGMGFDAMGDGKNEFGVDLVEEDGEMFSVCCKKGRRRHQMEDRHMTAIHTSGDSQLAFFGVFDGHGGAGAAEFVSRNIDKHVMNEVAKSGDDEIEIKEAVRTGYMKLDSHLLKEEVAGGSCGVTALIRDNDLIISNAGDCRAVLSRGGAAVAITNDHKLSREDERDRIERLGGYVDCFNGIWRLQGSLAVSRGFGDALLKQYVTAEPETEVLKLEPEHEFLILASDGLWDKVSNQEAVDVARPMCAGSTKGSVLSACKKLVELSISRGSVDDVSVMIILLRNFLQGARDAAF